jgi:hypothetical protein
MQFQVNVNNHKSNLFIELLNLFKEDNMINDYKIIDPKEDSYDNEVLNDLLMIGKAIEDAKKGVGDRTSMSVSITDV